jgi:hypothetical protein
MRSRFRSLLPAASLVGSYLAAPAAWAESPEEDSRALADVEFADAKKLMDEGETSAACAKFSHSQQLDPKLGRLLNLAFCHEQEGKTASAWSEYNGAAALAEQRGQADRVDFAREHAAAVAKKLAFVHLDVPANAVAVEIDGAGIARDRWPTPLPLDPGEHKVTVSAPGKRARSISTVIGANPGIVELQIAALVDESPAAPGPPQASSLPAAAEGPPASSTGTGPTRVPAYVATGIAAAGLGVGVGFGLQALAKKSSADSSCPNKLCNPTGSSLVSDARSAATISTIGFGVAAAGGVAAVWLFLRPPGGDSTSTRISPQLGPRTAGLSVEGPW